MKKNEFYEKINQAREENQKVMCIIQGQSKIRYSLYVISDLLDPRIDINAYDYEEVKGIEYVSLDLGTEKEQNGIASTSIKNLILSSKSIVDYDTSIKNIIYRFKLYISYFYKFVPMSNQDDYVYLYYKCMDAQHQIAKQLGISMHTLYDKASINNIEEVHKKVNLLKFKSLKYNYIGFVYVNVYTFEIFLQLHFRPIMDFLFAGVTTPISGNLLVAILPGDTLEQIFTQYIKIQSDFASIITIH